MDKTSPQRGARKGMGFDRHPSMRFSTKRRNCKDKTLSWASIAFDDSKDTTSKRKSKFKSTSREFSPAVEDKKEMLNRHLKTSDRNKPKIHRITSFYLNKTFSNIFMPKSKSSSSLYAKEDKSVPKTALNADHNRLSVRRNKRPARQTSCSHYQPLNAYKMQRSLEEANRISKSSLKSGQSNEMHSQLKLTTSPNFNNSTTREGAITEETENICDYGRDLSYLKKHEIFIYKNIRQTIENLALVNFLYYLPISVAFVIWYLFFDLEECLSKIEILETIILAALCISYSFVVVRSSIVIESLKRSL